MACPSLFFLVLLFLAATPSSYGNITIDGQDMSELRVFGHLECSFVNPFQPPQPSPPTPQPPLPPQPPVPPECGCGCESYGTDQISPFNPGVNVSLSCDGAQTSLADAITDPTGAFRIILKTIESFVFAEGECAIYVNLPLVSCAILPPSGVLRAPIRFFAMVPSEHGPVGVYRIDSFQHVPNW
ncbi:hypothetical protein NMG60_11003538 [Bertholletia excelsa]